MSTQGAELWAMLTIFICGMAYERYIHGPILRWLQKKHGGVV